MMKRASGRSTPYKFSNVQVIFPNERTAVIGYKVKQKGMMDGKPYDMEAADASTWTKSGDEWLCVTHSETTPRRRITEVGVGVENKRARFFAALRLPGLQAYHCQTEQEGSVQALIMATQSEPVQKACSTCRRSGPPVRLTVKSRRDTNSRVLLKVKMKCRSESNMESMRLE